MDNLIIKNINNLGNKKTFIDDQIVIFEKSNSKIVFIPLECDFSLLNKVFKREENKKYCEFHLFGIGEKEVENKLKTLKDEVDGLEYKFNYENLLCDIVVAYNGNTTLIDDNQVKIASAFKQNAYSENDMKLTEIVSKMLSLKNKNISICENITKGKIIYSLLKDNENFKELLKTATFDNFDYLNNDALYEKAVEFLKETNADIAIMTNGKFTENGLEFNYALADNQEVHIFKNNFKANQDNCIEMAKNSLLFHLVKKLRQNDITF